MSENETITVEEMDELAAEIQVHVNNIKELEAKIKDINKELTPLKAKALTYLKDMDRSSWHLPDGTQMNIKRDMRVAVPKGESRQVFFEYLKEKGVFEDYATVNAQSLNAFYKAEMRSAEEEGVDPMTFSLPGIDAPRINEYIKIK